MRYLSNEELQLATHFLFLSMAITVMEQDIQHIQKGNFKIKEPYLELLDKMTSEAFNERRKLRREMRRKNIQVSMIDKNDLFSSFLFLCQGREEKRNYFNPAIRKRVKIILTTLLTTAQKELSKDLQHDPHYNSAPSKD